MLNRISPHRIAEVVLSRRAEKALLRQARVYWVGTRHGLKQAVRQYVRRHRGAGALFSLLCSPARAAAAALLALQLYATPVGASDGGPTFGAEQINPFGLADVGNYSKPAFADLDGDGDFDMVSGASSGDFYYFENTGTASAPAFAAATANPFGLADVGSHSTPAFVDLDGDGDFDMVSGGSSGNFHYFQNTGTASTPAFAGSSSNPFGLTTAGSYTTPTFVDLDGDGDFDMVNGDIQFGLDYFQNTGTTSAPLFSALTDQFGLSSENGRSAPSFVDLDNDGDMDLMSGEAYGEFRYQQNTGSSSAPAFASSVGNPFELTTNNTYYRAPTFVDLDGDGDLDLMSGISTGNFAYFANDSPAPEFTASFSDFSFGFVSVNDTTEHPQKLQIDNDGDADLTLDLIGLTGDAEGNAFLLTGKEYDANGNFIQDISGLTILFGVVTIEPGHYVEFAATFTPNAERAFGATATFSTNDPDEDEFTITLSGTGGVPGPGGGGFSSAIVIDEAYSTPGDEGPLTLDVTLVNTTEDSVAGLQFEIDLSDVDDASPALEALAGFLTNEAPEGFELASNWVGEDTIRVVLFSTNGSLIQPGEPTLLGQLHFTPGSETGTDPVRIVPNTIRVSDPDGNQLSFGWEDGALWVIDVSLDLNEDAETDIRDIVLFVAELVGRPGYELPWDVQSEAFQIRDGNNSETLDVGDAIAMVNKVLRLLTGKAIAGGAPAGVSFGALTALSDGRVALPVIVDGAGIAGLQASFTFDPAKIQIGAPVSQGGELLLDSQTKDGVLNVIAISLNAQGLSASGPSVFYLPVTFLAEDGLISLSAVTLADRGANPVSLNPGVVGQTISKQGAAPKSFALKGARPNPFNPSTGIAYEVPAQAHITLTVYNLLGQEIVTLVNQVQAAGRYEVTWNALNAQGQAVSSGVYLYRMTTDRGYSETKRMTLLK